MIIDAISDLHGNFPELEGGDLLIVAGDLTESDSPKQLSDFCEWIDHQQYKKKIVIPGNHDTSLHTLFLPEMEEERAEYLWGAEYLCDSGTEFEYEEFETCLDSTLAFTRKKKLKIWGSPWTLTFPGINPKCAAFTGDEKLLGEKFALIPDDIDILVTHGPPHGIMDEVKRYDFDHRSKIENVGSLSLLMKATSLPRLKLFVFGHIHQAYGVLDTAKEWGRTKLKEMLPPPKCKSFPTIVNCSHVNERYEPVNKPVRIIL